MKIAICQMSIIYENKEKNKKTAEKYIQEASVKLATLILFPEMSLTGFSMNTCVTKEYDKNSVEFIQDLAIKYHIAIGIGWVEGIENKSKNHYSIITEKGEILSDYVKIHPFSYAGEDIKFLSGDSISLFQMNQIYFSTFICYDLRFPEVFQVASEVAHMIIVPANWPAIRSEQWKCLLRARAIENQVYMIGVNCVGQQQDTYYSGDSCIINPNGEILQCLSDAEDIVIVDIEDDITKYRNEFPTKKDRRDKLYTMMR